MFQFSDICISKKYINVPDYFMKLIDTKKVKIKNVFKGILQFSISNLT